MIKSMTGFGRYEHQLGTRKFTVELKGVNHRYLDVNIRMPKKLNFFETSIRSMLKTYARSISLLHMKILPRVRFP